MTDRQYIKQMIVLTEQLERVASAEPFDSAAWESAVDEFHLFNCHWIKTRRRRPWGFIFFIIFLLYCLSGLIWAICF